MEKIKVIRFTADWCGPCQRFKPTWDLSVTNYPNYKFQVVDCTDDTMTAHKWKVQSIPTILVVEGGREVDRVTGANTQSYYDMLNRWL